MNLVGDVALHEGEHGDPLTCSHRRHLMQRRRGIQDHRAGLALDLDRLAAEMNHQLAAFITRGLTDEERGRHIRAERSVGQRQIGRIRMRTIGHAHFVARQHGRGDAFPERETPDFLVAANGLAGDLRGALRFGLGNVHLQIVLGEVVRIGRPAVHEPDDPRNLADLVQFGRRQHIFDEKKHEGPELARHKPIPTTKKGCHGLRMRATPVRSARSMILPITYRIPWQPPAHEKPRGTRPRAMW